MNPNIPSGMPVAAVGISWYRAADYVRLRAMMADPETLPATFEKFLYRAHKAEEQVRAAGRAVIRVHLDDDKFPSFCRERGLSLDANGRRMYAAFVAMQMVEADKRGEA